MKLIIPPPIQGLITGAAMWAVSRMFPELNQSFPLQQPVAAGLVLIGLGVELIAVAAFFKAKTTVTPLKPEKASALVTGGLYRFSRNPMYLGMAILLTGWALWLGNPANALLVAAFIASITLFQIRPEEAALRAKFGEAYEDYARRVRRWI